MTIRLHALAVNIVRGKIDWVSHGQLSRRPQQMSAAVAMLSISEPASTFVLPRSAGDTINVKATPGWLRCKEKNVN